MKKLIFRPLRLNKKTGKIIVASYFGWRKLKTADYSNFELTVIPEYKGLGSDAFVYDHKGQQLFWFNIEPEEIATQHPLMEDEERGEFREKHLHRFVQYPHGGGMYNSPALDVDGVPVFSYFTADHAATCGFDITLFEPLTVGMVVKWFGWFLYQLENSNLQIK